MAAMANTLGCRVLFQAQQEEKQNIVRNFLVTGDAHTPQAHSWNTPHLKIGGFHTP